MEKLLKVMFTCLALALPGLTLGADPGTAVASPEKNKTLVLDFFRVVFEGENAEAAKDYLTPGYIQHNPNVVTGRDGFIAYFKKLWPTPKPAPEKLTEAPVSIVAEGNMVVLIWKRTAPDPGNPGSTYDFFTFDAFRVEKGKLAEHWDSARKAAN